jgi:hypothetical protein
VTQVTEREFGMPNKVRVIRITERVFSDPNAFRVAAVTAEKCREIRFSSPHHIE